MSKYYLTGPIQSNAQTLLVYSSGGAVYFLTLVKGINGGPNELIFDPRPTGDNNSLVSPLIINPVGTSSTDLSKYSLLYKDDNNDTKYIGVDSTTSLAVSSINSEAYILSQTEANPWTNVPFLAGVNYSILTPDNNKIMWKTYVADEITSGAASSIKTKADGSALINTWTGTIRAIPTAWYQKGTCEQTQDISSVLTAEEFWLSGQLTVSGFTDLTDCQNGVIYNYCPTNQQCGSNCKGPCPTSEKSGLKCLFNSSNNGFECKEPPVQEPFYRRPWFIIGLVVVMIIFLTLFILFLARFSRKKG